MYTLIKFIYKRGTVYIKKNIIWKYIIVYTWENILGPLTLTPTLGLMCGRVKIGERDLVSGGDRGSWVVGVGALGVNSAVIRSISAGCVIIMCHYTYVIIIYRSTGGTYYLHSNAKK